MKSIFRTNKGITLIALVVTIVILLILAGVSISLVLDNNGIIGKSKESRLETRASQVEDEIGLWKQNNFIKSETGESIENANAVLQSLLSRKLLNEEEIDRENEIITIKRNDGSILKQIEYGNDKYYVTSIKASNIWNNTAKVMTKLAARQPTKLAYVAYHWCVALRDKATDTLQTFTTAYIIYDNQKFDISSEISEKDGYSYIEGFDIRGYLQKNLEDFDSEEFYSSEQQFIIEKDGTEYKGYAKVCPE